MEWYWYLLIGWVICYLLGFVLTSDPNKEENSKVMKFIISIVISFIVPLLIIYFIANSVKNFHESKYGGHITDRH
ncbi:hypothetical protein [Metabacillus fastidiosus]|uniref:hypothetical protein n=1 Tax=Metabacillus fastidiosus TaxID=1458 RepID=UPI002DBD36B7|nr:hypothetical protein [Metabacillus fastidiosus]MEC2078645.1 hypothetical protein [Metabacillus fastidiosus]